MSNPKRHPWETDTRVRVIRKSRSGDPNADSLSPEPSDREYQVEHFVDGKDGDDAQGKDYYLIDSQNSIGGCYWAYPEDLELTQSVEQLAARELPTFKDLRSGISSALFHAHGDTFEFDGADYTKKGLFAYGRTHEGLEFSVEIKIKNIEEIY